MLSTIMEYCNNYFVRTTEDIKCQFDSETKTLTFSTDLVESYAVGQYIKIEDTILNDDVYKITAITNNTITVYESINDEIETEIVLTGLKIPKDFINIVTNIQADITAGKYNDVAEISRGDTTIKYGSNSTSTWQDDYNSTLFPYKKVRLV